jgi:hypothetical protein
VSRLERENRCAGSRIVRRALGVALGVGSAVSLGHALVPTARWWPAVHVCLPALVYTAGARAAGKQLTAGVVARGLAVVVLVATAFSVINDRGALPLTARIGLNFLVPFMVTVLGSLPAGRKTT